MIVLDIETSGLNALKNGVWQIGAIDLDNLQDVFLGESRIDDDDIVNLEALSMFDKTEEALRDINNSSQREMLEKFIRWLEDKKERNFLCQNPGFDVNFIIVRMKKYGLKFPFHHRSYDLHSIAQLRYFQLNKKFLIKGDHSGMSLTEVLKFVGIPDLRVKMDENEKMIKEGKPHNALEDAKLTAECFNRIVYGENLLGENSQFEVPDYLKVENDNL
jgi:DNA polymerase III epsilon subunit-like protein